MNKLLILSSLVFAIVLWGCNKDDHDHNHGTGENNQSYIDAADCTGNSPTYSADIAAILNTSCATSGCHDATTAAQGILFDTYQNTLAHFDAHNTICSVSHDEGCVKMPLGRDKLSDDSILKLTCWAKNGFVE